MMILLALMAVAAAARIEIEVTTECTTCVLLDNTCYNATHLLDIQAPFRNTIVIHKMDILESGNVLYYSFEPSIDDDEYFKVGFVSLDYPDHAGVITGGPNFIMNFGTLAIDQKSRRVYLGGMDGIFFLELDNLQLLKPYSSRGDEIRTIFFKDYVYFVRYEDRGIIVKKGDNFKTLLEYRPVKNFVVNKNDFIVFLNRYGLYVAKGDETYRLSRNPFFRGLTIDRIGEVYTWWIDGIYRVVIDKQLNLSKIVRVGQLTSIGAMAFDRNNNIIYTSDRSVYRLTRTNYNCTVY